MPLYSSEDVVARRGHDALPYVDTREASTRLAFKELGQHHSAPFFNTRHYRNFFSISPEWLSEERNPPTTNNFNYKPWPYEFPGARGYDATQHKLLPRAVRDSLPPLAAISNSYQATRDRNQVVACCGPNSAAPTWSRHAHAGAKKVRLEASLRGPQSGPLHRSFTLL